MLNEKDEFKNDTNLSFVRLTDDSIAHGSIGRRLLFAVARGYLFFSPDDFEFMKNPRDLSALSEIKRKEAINKAYRALQAYVSVDLHQIEEYIIKYETDRESIKNFRALLSKIDPFDNGSNSARYFDDKANEFPELVKNGNGILARFIISKFDANDDKTKKNANLAHYLVKLATSISGFEKSFFAGQKVGELDTITFDSILAEAYNAGPLKNYRVIIKDDDVERYFDKSTMKNRNHFELLMFFMALLKVLETNKRIAIKDCPNDFVQVTLSDVKNWLQHKKVLECTQSDPFYAAECLPICGCPDNDLPLFIKASSRSKVPMFMLNPVIFDAMQVDIVDSKNFIQAPKGYWSITEGSCQLL